jgi:hypothetical protein
MAQYYEDYEFISFLKYDIIKYFSKNISESLHNILSLI